MQKRNQREIKMRFWYEVNRTMSPPMTIKEIVQDVLNSSSDQTRKEKLSYNVEMQYTGIKDNNGKEIYEGDIMRYLARYPKDFQEDNPHRRFGRVSNGVSWSDNYCCFLIDSTYEKELVFLGFDENKQWEVIGNIYENPELLSTEK